MKKNFGFTLIELMVTIAVLAIVVTVAVPDFRHFVRSNATTGQTNALLADLQLARSTAVSRNRPTEICASNDGATCSGSSWSAGYLVWVDDNGDGAMTNDEIVRIAGPTEHNTSISAADDTGTAVAKVDFQASGFADLGSASKVIFKIRPSSCSNNEGRNISVTSLGRAGVSDTGTCS